MNNKKLPSGTVTFLFSDIEGNTPLWERNPVAMEAALQLHNRILNGAISSHSGVVFKIVGDEFQAAFSTAHQALAAAIDAQRELSAAPWNALGPLKVRMGIHTGEAVLDDIGDEYVVSHTKNRGHRIMEAGHGGQILLSKESAALCEPVLLQGISLKELGQYHLKGLTRLEQIFQVVGPQFQADFPPLRTIDTARHNLPLQLTNFIGREKEIEDIETLLRENGSVNRLHIPSRLVTLSGVGGTGKTRLALQVAAGLIDKFPDGLWLVELARVADPALIPHSTAAVFGLREEKGREVVEILDNYLHFKRLLIILDNCEHLISEVAQFVDHLLHRAPGVKILTTSREALGLTGEKIYPVPSLGKPDPANLPPLGSLIQYEAVQLFMDRATAVLPSFRVTSANASAIAQICHRLDGIPLALELAASRIKVLSVEQIAARLNDCFRLLTGGNRAALPRQQTLQATIDWSYGLLSEPERTLLRCSSVFTGGWTLEAIETVATGVSGLDPAIVLDLLSQLVNKSIIFAVAKEGMANRYFLLETIRQYAQVKLIEAGDANITRDGHLAYYLAFAEKMNTQITTGDQIAAFDNLDLEIDNIRSAVGWAFSEASDDTALLGLRLVTAIGWYLELRSSPEAIDWLNKGLSLVHGEDRLHKRIRAAAYFSLGIRYTDTDIPEAKRWLRESVRLYRSLKDLPGLALVLVFLGMTCAILDPLRNSFSTDIEAAWDCCQESETIFRESNDSWGIRLLYSTKLAILYFTRDYVSLKQLVKQLEGENIVPIQDSETRVFPEFYNAILLGMVAFEQADFQNAYRYFLQNMHLSRMLHANSDVATGLCWIGIVAFALGDFPKTAEHFEEALPLFQETGFEYFTNWVLRCLSTTALAQGQVDCARNYLLKCLTKKTEQENISETVFFLLHAAGVIGAESCPDYAASLLGMIQGQFASIISDDRIFGEKVFLQWITAFVRSRLDETAFTKALAGGGSLSLEKAIEEVYCLLKGNPVS